MTTIEDIKRVRALAEPAPSSKWTWVGIALVALYSAIAAYGKYHYLLPWHTS